MPRRSASWLMLCGCSLIRSIILIRFSPPLEPAKRYHSSRLASGSGICHAIESCKFKLETVLQHLSIFTIFTYISDILQCTKGEILDWVGLTHSSLRIESLYAIRAQNGNTRQKSRLASNCWRDEQTWMIGPLLLFCWVLSSRWRRFVTIIVRCGLKGSIAIAVASVLSTFAGINGASHGPGQILQSSIAASAIIIKGRPELMILAGEPARTLVPSFSVSGIVTVIIGLAVKIWAPMHIESKKGALVSYCSHWWCSSPVAV